MYILNIQAPKKKFERISDEKIESYIENVGPPPKTASYQKNSYWTNAAQFCYNVKNPSAKLCDATRHQFKSYTGLKVHVIITKCACRFISIKKADLTKDANNQIHLHEGEQTEQQKEEYQGAQLLYCKLMHSNSHDTCSFKNISKLRCTSNSPK